MPIKVERLPLEPIIVATVYEPANPAQDASQIAAETAALIGPDEMTVCVINDFRQMKIDFKMMMSGMSATRAERTGGVGDPRVYTILVGEGIVWEVAQKSVGKFLSNGPGVALFASMDEALAHAREKIKTW